MLDTREYIVQFPNGAEAECSANIIAENTYAQCDIEGNQHLLLKYIVDYQKSEVAVAKADQYFIYKGRKSVRNTTKGWKLYF